MASVFEDDFDCMQLLVLEDKWLKQVDKIEGAWRSIRLPMYDIPKCYNYGDRTIWPNIIKGILKVTAHGMELKNAMEEFENQLRSDVPAFLANNLYSSRNEATLTKCLHFCYELHESLESVVNTFDDAKRYIQAFAPLYPGSQYLVDEKDMPMADDQMAFPDDIQANKDLYYEMIDVTRFVMDDYVDPIKFKCLELDGKVDLLPVWTSMAVLLDDGLTARQSNILLRFQI